METYLRKLRIYFLIYFVSIIFLSNLLIGLFILNVSYKNIKDETLSKLGYLTKLKALEYSDIFNRTERNVKRISDVVTSTIDMKKCKKNAPIASKYTPRDIPYVGSYIMNTLNPLILLLVQNAPCVFGGYFNFDPKFMPNKHILGSWITKTPSNKKLHYEDSGLISKLYPLTQPASEWFYKPMMLHKGCWGKVYTDRDINVEMISYTAPVYINNQFVGVAGMDISLNQIKNDVLKFKLYKTGYASLLNNDMQFIFSSKYKSNENLGDIENGKFKYLIEKIRSNENGVISIKQNGKYFFVGFSHLTNGFILLVMIPKNEVLYELNRLEIWSSGLLLLLIILSSIISVKIAKKIAGPMENLTEISKKLMQEKFNFKIPKKTNIEEIDSLSESLMKFSNIYQEHRENENLLNTIMATIPDGIVIIKDCVIKECNISFCNIFGYNKNEVLGDSLHKFLINNNLEKCNRDFLNSNCFIRKNLNSKIEIIGKNKNGNNFPIEVIIIEILVKHEAHYMIIVKDLTTQKEVEKTKNEFVSTVSHELRTPLTALSGALELILSGKIGEISDKIKNLLNMAYNNCSRLSNLINDILDIEKIKAGKMDFCFNKHEVMSLVENAVQLNEEYAKLYKVRYEIVNKINNVLIDVDKERFIQVLTNLLSNAAKFSFPNEVVKIGIEINNELISILITNRGCGIPEEYYSKIFKPFSQVDSSDNRSKGGTGLGLNISKSIIENMNGKIGFYSALNEETTFYIELPISNKETVTNKG